MWLQVGAGRPRLTTQPLNNTPNPNPSAIALGLRCVATSRTTGPHGMQGVVNGWC